LQGLLVVNGIIADDNTGQDGFFPGVEVVYFGYRKVEITVQFGENGFDHPAFLFEGAVFGHVQVEGQDGDGEGGHEQFSRRIDGVFILL